MSIVTAPFRTTLSGVVFGLSFGEVVLLLLIAVVVIGPRNLPEMLRTLGKTVGKARRVATDLREQSGIDEILRMEGLEREVQELRKIAQGRILDVNLEEEIASSPRRRATPPPRSREYPTGGPDAYGALPEDTEDYAPTASALPAPPAPTADDEAPAAPEIPRLAAPDGERFSRSSTTSLVSVKSSSALRPADEPGAELPPAAAHDAR